MMRQRVSIFKGEASFLTGAHAAAELRDSLIIPALKSGQEVELDFSEIRGTTQSWMNALLMVTLLECGLDSLRRLHFANCSPLVKELVKFAVVKAESRSLAAA